MENRSCCRARVQLRDGMGASPDNPLLVSLHPLILSVCEFEMQQFEYLIFSFRFTVFIIYYTFYFELAL